MSNQPPLAQPVNMSPVTNSDSRTMAMLVHLLAIFTGWVGPLILYLVKKDQDKFVAFHGLQALFWELAIMVLAFAAVAVTICLFGIGGFAIIALKVVFNVILLIKANNGEWYKYPLVGDWAMNSIR